MSPVICWKRGEAPVTRNRLKSRSVLMYVFQSELSWIAFFNASSTESSGQ
jgi:hypothetical protein